MSLQHRELAAGRWQSLPLVEQMANIGSEVERALNWRARGDSGHCQRALERALELLDMSLAGGRGYACLKELCRVREALVDYFCGDNTFGSTQESWRRYFLSFAHAARRNH